MLIDTSEENNLKDSNSAETLVSKKVSDDEHTFTSVTDDVYEELNRENFTEITDEDKNALMQSKEQLIELITYYDSIKDTESEKTDFIWKQLYYYPICEGY